MPLKFRVGAVVMTLTETPPALVLMHLKAPLLQKRAGLVVSTNAWGGVSSDQSFLRFPLPLVPWKVCRSQELCSPGRCEPGRGWLAVGIWSPTRSRCVWCPRTPFCTASGSATRHDQQGTRYAAESVLVTLTPSRHWMTMWLLAASRGCTCWRRRREEPSPTLSPKNLSRCLKLIVAREGDAPSDIWEYNMHRLLLQHPPGYWETGGGILCSAHGQTR